MLLALVLILIVLALFGGFYVHNLIWILVVVLLVLLVLGYTGNRGWYR